jgi:hypothetical protein
MKEINPEEMQRIEREIRKAWQNDENVYGLGYPKELVDAILSQIHVEELTGSRKK